MLSVLLKPWHRLVSTKDVFTGAYADDRSVKAVAGSCEAAAVLVERALLVTAEFDDAIGLSENAKKRQRWQGNQKVEHLGLTLPLGGDASASVQGSGLPAPRDGWDSILDAIKRLIILPGGFVVRAGIAATCITPKFRWAAPLIAQPPAGIAIAMRRALLRTNCTWWCQARFWAENVHLHPNFAVAIQALKAAVGLARSNLLDDAVATHATVLDVETCRNAQGRLRVRAAAHADLRTTTAMASAATACAAAAALASRKAALAATRATAGFTTVRVHANRRITTRPRSRTPPIRRTTVLGTVPPVPCTDHSFLGHFPTPVLVSTGPPDQDGTAARSSSRSRSPAPRLSSLRAPADLHAAPPFTAGSSPPSDIACCPPSDAVCRRMRGKSAIGNRQSVNVDLRRANYARRRSPCTVRFADRPPTDAHSRLHLRDLRCCFCFCCCCCCFCPRNSDRPHSDDFAGLSQWSSLGHW